MPPPMLSDTQVRALLRTCEGGKSFEEWRDLAIMRLLFDTGARRSELAYLSLDDVDLDNNLLRVLGKGSRVRVVPFGTQQRIRPGPLPARANPTLRQRQFGAVGRPQGANERWCHRPDAAPPRRRRPASRCTPTCSAIRMRTVGSPLVARNKISCTPWRSREMVGPTVAWPPLTAHATRSADCRRGTACRNDALRHAQPAARSRPVRPLPHAAGRSAGRARSGPGS